MPELFDQEFLRKSKESADNLRADVQAIGGERVAKERQSKRYRRLILVLSIIMAIGAVLAALPVVLDLISRAE